MAMLPDFVEVDTVPVPREQAERTLAVLEAVEWAVAIVVLIAVLWISGGGPPDKW